ncbi:histone-like nucleoid-structuring protein, MvaT/MvaU family [Hahella sp. NBU794]|uniref:histone-like nucleoid-structuring protein, MvaT/MvaU family n=1 Tax=Hahella sp. NBU794 TaxID=3422590 RepID=UPI003D6EE86C
MNKLSAYIEAKAAYENLKRKIEALESDESVKKTLEFQKKLQDLMDKYGVSKEEVVRMWNKDEKPSATDKRRGVRPLKVYKNPHTGEVVKTRGGNHKVLNEWRGKHGKETVDSWIS